MFQCVLNADFNKAVSLISPVSLRGEVLNILIPA